MAKKKARECWVLWHGDIKRNVTSVCACSGSIYKTGGTQYIGGQLNVDSSVQSGVHRWIKMREVQPRRKRKGKR